VPTRSESPNVGGPEVELFFWSVVSGTVDGFDCRYLQRGHIQCWYRSASWGLVTRVKNVSVPSIHTEMLTEYWE
jgi:hypothetical protein